MNQNCLEIIGLSKTYKTGVKALKSVDLRIKDGDFFALLGANGAGKTTLIGILTGTVMKTKGLVKIFGIDIDDDHNAAKKMVGVVPQEFNFNIFEKVLDIVCQQAGYFGVTRKQAEKDAEPILKRLELWEKRSTRAIQLSGGMKRRLMIARALIHHPKLLILDEPTAGVDVELRHGMWGYLKEINARGTTILLTTHYIEEAENLCKNVAIIKEGEIIKAEPVETLVKQLEVQTYVVHVQNLSGEFKMSAYEWKRLDDNRIEVQLKRGQDINTLVKTFDDMGMTIHDLAPKSNRLEQLFLNILKQ